MIEFLSVAVLVAIQSGGSAPTPNTSPPEHDTPAEEIEWRQVDGLDPASLEAFLERFPMGQHAQKAQLFLSFHRKIEALQNQREKPEFVIPFSEFGERWKSWQSRRPERSTLGIFAKQNATGASLGFFSPLGGTNRLSFDELGNPVAPTGDGSVIAFRTNGFLFSWVDSIALQTPGDEPLYFAVIRNLGLAYLHGRGTVFVNQRRFSLPIADSPRASPTAADSDRGSLVVAGIGAGVALALVILAHRRRRLKGTRSAGSVR